MKKSTWLVRWHRYCALATLVFVLLAALTGTLLLYKKPVLRYLVAGGATLPADYSQQDVVQDLQKLALDSGYSALSLKAPNAEEPYWLQTHSDGRKQLYAVISLQPYENNLWLVSALDWVRRFHFTLLAGVIGEVVMLFVGLSLLFLLLGGIYLWWPARGSFRWRWVFPSPILAKRWLLYHRHAGIVALPTILLVSFTGTMMLQQKMWGLLIKPDAVESPEKSIVKSSHNNFPVADLLQAAQLEFPEAWPTYIRVREGQAKVRFRQPGEWHSNGRNSVTLGAVQTSASPSIEQVSRTEAATTGRQFLNQMYPLHSSYGLADSYRILLSFSAIATLWLSITGALSWWRRHNYRKC